MVLISSQIFHLIWIIVSCLQDYWLASGSCFHDASHLSCFISEYLAIQYPVIVIDCYEAEGLHLDFVVHINLFGHNKHWVIVFPFCLNNLIIFHCGLKKSILIKYNIRTFHRAFHLSSLWRHRINCPAKMFIILHLIFSPQLSFFITKVVESFVIRLNIDFHK